PSSVSAWRSKAYGEDRDNIRIRRDWPFILRKEPPCIRGTSFPRIRTRHGRYPYGSRCAAGSSILSGGQAAAARRSSNGRRLLNGIRKVLRWTHSPRNSTRGSWSATGSRDRLRRRCRSTWAYVRRCQPISALLLHQKPKKSTEA